MKARTLVYVAGPYSPTAAQKEAGLQHREAVEQNIGRAESVGVAVAELGFFPVIPHANTADARFEKAQPYSFWIVGTDELLRRCDVLLTAPGWEQSSGARDEVRTAKSREMPVFHTIEDLEKWGLSVE